MVELLNNLANSIQETTSMSKLDRILRNVALNLTVDGKKIVKLALKEPFNEFMELKNAPKGVIGGHVKADFELNIFKLLVDFKIAIRDGDVMEDISYVLEEAPKMLDNKNDYQLSNGVIL